MATHRTDVSVGFAAPDPLESKIQPAENLLLHVPDVRMLTEAAATATIASVGLGLLYRYADRFELNGYWGFPLNHRPDDQAGDPMQDAGFHLEARLFVF